jgi:hypothetical protein
VSAEPLFIETNAPPKEAYGALLAELRRYTTKTVGAPDNCDFAILIQDPETGGRPSVCQAVIRAWLISFCRWPIKVNTSRAM